MTDIINYQSLKRLGIKGLQPAKITEQDLARGPFYVLGHGTQRVQDTCGKRFDIQIAVIGYYDQALLFYRDQQHMQI